MKQKKNLIFAGTLVAALVIGLGIGRLSAPDAGAGATSAAESPTPAAANAAPSTWTCSMHPQIQQPAPGDCPICGMDLIPLDEDDDGDQGPRTLSMSESARKLAEIETTTVQRTYPEATIRIVGTLDYDETREKSLSARFPARIERLFVNFTGIRVQPGEHLAVVYSPELLSAQRELLTAHRTDPDSSITAAARAKLRLWDLLPEQIDAIIERGTASDHFELRAPTGGVVVSKNVKEGDYVKTGDQLFKIVDLDTLWLNLQAYESDLQWLRYGQKVEFEVEAYPGEPFTGTITFIEPELNRKTRTVPVRVNVPNPDGRLKPGMFARGQVQVKVAEGGSVYVPELAGMWISPMHPEVVKDHPGQCDVCGMDLVPVESLGYADNSEAEAPLVVPSSAVLRTGKRAVVYVEVPDADRPTYEGREIVLGPRAGGFFVVKSGLEAGDKVVTHGAFKIDSALQIQAKPSMMNPDGGGSATGHDHGSTSTGETPAAHDVSLKIDTDTAGQIMPAYLALGSALAGDNLDGARAALRSMMEITGHTGPLPDLIHTMLAADALDGMRRPHFEILSNALIDAVERDPGAFDKDLLLMHCPMVYSDRGADWIQAGEPLLNPYFGAMMLKCGEVRGAFDNATEQSNTSPDHAH